MRLAGDVFQTPVVSGSDEKFVKVGLGGHPVQRGTDLFWRSGLREVACVDEDVTCREGRQRGVAVVGVRNADYTDGVV